LKAGGADVPSDELRRPANRGRVAHVEEERRDVGVTAQLVGVGVFTNRREDAVTEPGEVQRARFADPRGRARDDEVQRSSPTASAIDG
jgi:hypothetical protein